MALVDYPSSPSSDDQEGEEAEPTPTTTATFKRKHDEELPPLPSKFHDLYASTTRVSTRDDPALHEGRKRVTPHVEGNWPTHIYLEWYPSTAENRSLSSLISELKNSIRADNATVNSSLTSDLGAPLPLHVSLSRPIGFSTEVKDAFVTSLECSIKSSGVRPFNVAVADLDWVSNLEKTRWFLVLRLHEPPSNSLNKVLHISNKVVQEYGQPTLYATPPEIHVRKSKSKGSRASQSDLDIKMDWDAMQNVSDAFHVSIAWMLERPSFELMATTKSLFTDGFGNMDELSFRAEEVKAKVGNLVTSIPLPGKVFEEKALWGG
ncbi:U6 snRNA phosphodiesterase [Hyphodiscus hymeniophilus]|uniref:U6 snRNA phosphodiesterase n=1 Tax=Hyphodiscus hymeniophilus TaxID=353542 RepID=A0A9P6VPE4_9HELO|nr:U6 snRNA phosphodiesterase [Hyphodiscus hymeniophilus]